MQTGKAVLVIVVAVVIGIAVLHHGPGSSHTPSGAAASTSHGTTTTSSTIPASTTTTTLVPAKSIKLQVLNGVGTGQLATAWSNKLKANPGYDTLAPDNATSKVPASVIYVMTQGYLPEAKALATTVGLPASAVNTQIPAPSSAPIPAKERAAPNLVLVIGPDLAGKA
ncbi:MAG: LytR C-terminal domain-containing protein [Acidimicrobiales bacterium]